MKTWVLIVQALTLLLVAWTTWSNTKLVRRLTEDCTRKRTSILTAVGSDDGGTNKNTDSVS